MTSNPVVSLLGIYPGYTHIGTKKFTHECSLQPWFIMAKRLYLTQTLSSVGTAIGRQGMQPVKSHLPYNECLPHIKTFFLRRQEKFEGIANDFQDILLRGQGKTQKNTNICVRKRKRYLYVSSLSTEQAWRGPRNLYIVITSRKRNWVPFEFCSRWINQYSLI